MGAWEARVVRWILYVGIFFILAGLGGIVNKFDSRKQPDDALTLKCFAVGAVCLLASFGWARFKFKDEPEIITKPISTSISPIKVTPDDERQLKLSLIDGEYRFFQNYHIDGVQYTFGFPKDNCKDKRIWVGRGTVEIERISLSEAQRRIANLNAGQISRGLN